MELTPEIGKQVKEEIEAICAKYNVALLPVVIHQGNRTFSSIDIVPATQPTQSEQPEVVALS